MAIAVTADDAVALNLKVVIDLANKVPMIFDGVK
jgi:hypothetical protein